MNAPMSFIESLTLKPRPSRKNARVTARSVVPSTAWPSLRAGPARCAAQPIHGHPSARPGRAVVSSGGRRCLGDPGATATVARTLVAFSTAVVPLGQPELGVVGGGLGYVRNADHDRGETMQGHGDDLLSGLL